LKSTSIIKVATIKIWHFERKQKSMLFTVSKEEWNTKEETIEAMNNRLYTLQYAERYS